MSHREKRESVKSGRYVTPEPVSDSSSLQNVFGFIQDYIPQSYSVNTVKSEKEKVMWARFEITDCNDVTMDHLTSEHTDDSMLPLLLIIGLTNSFSVWLISPGGDAREVYTYQNDPIKLATLLPTPHDTISDVFKDYRPLLAVVKKSNNSRSLFSSLVFLSLSGSDTNGKEIKRLEFEKNTIIDIKLNKRFVIVILQKRLVILDSVSLEQRYIVKTGYNPSSLWINPIALGVRWLAISDTKLHSYLQSMGGVSEQLTAPIASTVMNTVKKSFAAISDTISGITGRGSVNVQTKLSSTEDTAISSSPSIQPVVTILDLLYPYTGEVRVNELRQSEGVVAHFLTHLSADVYVTSMAFNKSGELLLTADSEGQFFNIFRILPSTITDCTNIQHLYSLYRGSTTGKVQDICFSNDSRWVGVSTLNGTTHIFPMSTYGGLCSVRTHTSPQVVNQLSRFHTSADIGSINNTSLPFPSHQSTQCINTIPIIVTPLQQIKQSYSSGITPVISSVSSSSIISNNHTSGGDDNQSFTTCIRSIFTSVCHKSDYNDQSHVQYSLYVMNGFGEVVEYLLEPQRCLTVTTSDNEESSIDLICLPKLRWPLLSKLTDEYNPLPFDTDNPLIKAYNDYKRVEHSNRESSDSLHEKEDWLAEVELLSYAPPTRRLWMGPQFTFKTFSDENLHEEGKEISSSSPTAILQPTNDVCELLDLSLLGLNSLHSTKEDAPSHPDAEGLDIGVEVFGSWKDVGPKLKTMKSDTNLEQQILDAMKDKILSSSPNTSGKQPTCSLITRCSPNKTQMGFNPSM